MQVTHRTKRDVPSVYHDGRRSIMGQPVGLVDVEILKLGATDCHATTAKSISIVPFELVLVVEAELSVSKAKDTLNL